MCLNLCRYTEIFFYSWLPYIENRYKTGKILCWNILFLPNFSQWAIEQGFLTLNFSANNLNFIHQLNWFISYFGISGGKGSFSRNAIGSRAKGRRIRLFLMKVYFIRELLSALEPCGGILHSGNITLSILQLSHVFFFFWNFLYLQKS